MIRWWKDLDRILRGDATRISSLSRGTIDVSVGGLSLVLLILGMLYGACMGSFGLFKAGGPSYLQLVASTLKVPALFVLTLVVTLPSLYVSNALVGSRLVVDSVIRLLVAALGVMMAVLASLGPIVAFFSLSTTSYPFMVLVNVVVFAVSGALGLSFLLQTLHRLSVAPRDAKEDHVPEILDGGEPDKAREDVEREDLRQGLESLRVGEAEGGNVTPPGALDPLDDRMLDRHVKTIFRCWVILFSLVGAQMGWVLRPFIGDPNLEFAWIRGRDSNFFQGVLHALSSLFS
ncbi:hypothetical protein P12x_002517 [Tundrisphaera lichenicola]|uniref:hypothetical protein n=1 Tax=Tundrisphaera lichenicola TaxID=2029860 RepID=UPI003EC12D0A